MRRRVSAPLSSARSGGVVLRRALHGRHVVIPILQRGYLADDLPQVRVPRSKRQPLCGRGRTFGHGGGFVSSRPRLRFERGTRGGRKSRSLERGFFSEESADSEACGGWQKEADKSTKRRGRNNKKRFSFQYFLVTVARGAYFTLRRSPPQTPSLPPAM